MDTQRDRKVGAAVAACLLLTLGGCTAGDTAASDVALDRATGAVLADAAERLAAALEAGDGCAASEEAAAFEAWARDAVEDRLAPPSIVAEAVRVIDVSTAGLTCTDGAAADDDAADDDAAASGAAGDGAAASSAGEASDPAPGDADTDTAGTTTDEEAAGGGTSGGSTDRAGDGSPAGSTDDADAAPPRGPSADRGRGGGPGRDDAPGRGEGRGRG